MQPTPAESYDLVPSPLIRVAGPDDVAFVSALAGADASEAMGRVITLISDHGFFFLEPITPSVLEAHMTFALEGRGSEALHAARAGLAYCFTILGTLVVFGRIPVEDRAARLFTRLIGFTSCGIRPHHDDTHLVEWFELRADHKGDF